MPATSNLAAWTRHLDAAADAMIAGRPARDAQGAIAPILAQAVDPASRTDQAAITDPSMPATGADPRGGDRPAGDRPGGDILLWSTLAAARTGEPWTHLDPIVDDVLNTRPPGHENGASPGPLFDQGLWLALEVWTATELAALHALWNLAARRPERPEWRQRAEAHRTWFLNEIQPDNATNRPWAIHVFLLDGGPEASFYAETLLHNAQTVGDDLLSGWILKDAAAELAKTLVPPA